MAPLKFERPEEMERGWKEREIAREEERVERQRKPAPDFSSSSGI